MTAESLWAAAGLARAVHHLDLHEPILEFNRAHEPLLIEEGSDRFLPDLDLR